MTPIRDILLPCLSGLRDNTVASHAEAVEHLISEIERAGYVITPMASASMKTTVAMRARTRELTTPPKDDFDRAVLALCDDFDSHHLALLTIALQRDEVMNGKDAGSWAKLIATQALK